MTRIDDEARRFAAAKLRAAAGALERDEQLTDGRIVDVVYDSCMDNEVFEHYTGDLCEVDREFFLRMADLIDRPTCENVGGALSFTCSECGASADGCRVAYCPSCGAEVAR